MPLNALLPIGMLLVSNVFMTFAWYGNFKIADKPMWLLILGSWGIAFIEYCIAVPANRMGRTWFSTAELKTMQEVITLIVFAVFSVTFLGEKLTANTLVGFGLIGAGAFFV
ncbi:MAG TPA: DMT family protein, partial [Caulobacteraceae bacterium]|nr:DMT family protein [Caulobacteraceae bacterium]